MSEKDRYNIALCVFQQGQRNDIQDPKVTLWGGNVKRASMKNARSLTFVEATIEFN